MSPYSSPKRPLTCWVAIVIAAAEVNPAITGMEMKSITKPAQSNSLGQGNSGVSKWGLRLVYLLSRNGLFIIVVQGGGGLVVRCGTLIAIVGTVKKKNGAIGQVKFQA